MSSAASKPVDIAGITQRRVPTNGISLNVAEQGEGPLVLLLHGFPESWYSWRHQMAPLAAAGYHVVAPDMRGYGKSDMHHEIAAYTQVEVVNDIIWLIPALVHKTAIVIGPDCVSPTAWAFSLSFPYQFLPFCSFSVPFSPLSPVSPFPLFLLLFYFSFFFGSKQAHNRWLNDRHQRHIGIGRDRNGT